MGKAISAIAITLLLTSILVFSFNIRPVRATTIHVPDDYATIQEAIDHASEGDMVFVRNGAYYENVIVNKTISLMGESQHFAVVNGSISVTADDVQISGFHVTFGVTGIYIHAADRTVVVDNLIDYNGGGVLLDSANQTVVANNTIDSNGGSGIFLSWSFNDTIVGNTISNTTASRSSAGLRAQYSNDSLIYHNNFIHNIWAPLAIVQSFNKWDDGYPVGGNYWGPSAYPSDVFKGSYQNETGSDGIIDGYFWQIQGIIDYYPLAKPWPWGSHDVGVTYTGKVKYPTVIAFRNFIWVGSTLRFDTFVMNYGNSSENVNVVAYANDTVIDQRSNVTLEERNSTILTLGWNSTGFPIGFYNITVYVEPAPSETEINDNVRSVWIFVYTVGDLNGDGKVDMKDIATVAKAFGQTVPPISPDLDVNEDWKIDMRDISIVARHFGESIS